MKGIRAGGMAGLLQVRPKLCRVQLCILAVLVISHVYMFIQVKKHILQVVELVVV